jgi:A/G-specific adenine glycosylase
MDMGTDLKTTIQNPNRRSRQYTKQAAFEGSDRKIRGRILRLLISSGRMTKKQVIATIGEDSGRMDQIIKNLEAEGFLTRSGSYLSISTK